MGLRRQLAARCGVRAAAGTAAKERAQSDAADTGNSPPAPYVQR
jgi:hypothetical protein